MSGYPEITAKAVAAPLAMQLAWFLADHLTVARWSARVENNRLARRAARNATPVNLNISPASASCVGKPSIGLGVLAALRLTQKRFKTIGGIAPARMVVFADT